MNKILFALMIAMVTPQVFANITPGDKIDSGTGVQNGGDPLLTYLSTLRVALVTTSNSLTLQSSNTLCDDVTPAEVKFLCKDLLKEALPQFISLANNPEIPFVLKAEPIYVKGPDGSFMTVAARTGLGNKGSIEFHRSSINTMSPKELLFLITHEYQHKLLYRGKYISDDETVSGVQGRTVIDSVANSIANYALNSGLIGTKLNITDIFDCRVRAAAQLEFGSLVRADRMMLGTGLTEYQISVGNNPYDASFFLAEGKDSKVNFKFVISEKASCSDPVPEFHRTKMEITRTTNQKDGSISEEVLATKDEIHNPTCATETAFFGMAYKEISFRCQYMGSAAATK